jgi:hypothetical protein
MKLFRKLLLVLALQWMIPTASEQDLREVH